MANYRVIQKHRTSYCNRYLYLGAWLTDTRKMEEVRQLHARQGQSVVNKFAVFCALNKEMPFIINLECVRQL